MNSRKLIFPAFYLLGWVVLYFLPARFYYDSSASWLTFLILLLVLPVLLYFSFQRFGVSYEWSKASAQLSALITIVVLGLTGHAFDKKELEVYGTETRGFIYKSYNAKKRKGRTAWSVKAMYIVENESYRTHLESDPHQIFRRGDTVTIIYSSKTPEISQIKELEEYYRKID